MEHNSNLTPQQQKELDAVNWRIAFQKKVTEQLHTNENIQHYFKKYNPDSVKRFIDSYSVQKSYWHQYGEFHLQQKEKHELQWIEAAWWHLEMIQQKKLFDLQCLWRAEEIVLPGIELCCDFGYWQENVLNCPFADAITAQEIGLYQQYLSQNNAELKEDMSFLLSFQNYEQLREDWLSEEEGQLPAWYEFHHSANGTSHLMGLPDIRGEKEAFYISLARSTQPGKSAAIAGMQQIFQDFSAGGPAMDRNGQEILNSFDPGTLEHFVETFEDKQTREFYKAAAWYHRDNEEKERIEEAVDLLFLAGEPVAIDGHHDWKQAIYNAARTYTINKIIEYLPGAYEQYLLNVSMNISFPVRNIDHMVAVKKLVREDILLGRKLNGEPEDLNF